MFENYKELQAPGAGAADSSLSIDDESYSCMSECSDSCPEEGSVLEATASPRVKLPSPSDKVADSCS